VIPTWLIAVAVTVSAAFTVQVAIQVLGPAWLVLGPVAVALVTPTVARLLAQRDLGVGPDR